jgi:hypothetical protein
VIFIFGITRFELRFAIVGNVVVYGLLRVLST